VPVVAGDLLGDQVLVDLVELAVNGLLALQVLTVQPFDELMGWLLALEVRVVAVAEVELAARPGWLPSRQQPGSWQLYFLTSWYTPAPIAPRMPNSSRSEPNPDQNP
jgi:hypothetical protein